MNRWDTMGMLLGAALVLMLMVIFGFCWWNWSKKIKALVKYLWDRRHYCRCRCRCKRKKTKGIQFKMIEMLAMGRAQNSCRVLHSTSQVHYMYCSRVTSFTLYVQFTQLSFSAISLHGYPKNRFALCIAEPTKL